MFAVCNGRLRPAHVHLKRSIHSRALTLPFNKRLGLFVAALLVGSIATNAITERASTDGINRAKKVNRLWQHLLENVMR